jgi:hypothetical protein
MEKILPRYQISIDDSLSQDGEHLGIDMIAYTADPAIQIKGMAFDAKKMVFKDELKYRLAAPILIPNTPIYRYDDQLGEYEVIFSTETIEKLYEDFMMNKGANGFNLDHNAELKSPSYVLESWITGPFETDPSYTKYGIQLPEGSVFMVTQFTDKEYFNTEIIAKNRTGYSIEGFLGLALSTINKKIKQTQMTKQKFEKALLEDGTALFISAMEVGGEVYVIDDNGDKAPIFDGEHKLSDGSTLVTINGLITEIRPMDAPIEMADPIIPTETPVVETPEAEAAIDEAAVLAIVQPKFDELYMIIAEIKTMIEGDNAEDVTESVLMNKLNSVDVLASFFEQNKQ